MLLDGEGWPEAVEEVATRVKTRKAEYRYLKEQADKALALATGRSTRSVSEEVCPIQRSYYQD